MNFAIGLIGIIAALVFLTVAVYKGWSILYSSIISVIIIALTNSLNLYEALTVNFVSSFTSYAAAYFILFCEGAMLGKLYDASGAAWKIGKRSWINVVQSLPLSVIWQLPRFLNMAVFLLL